MNTDNTKRHLNDLCLILIVAQVGYILLMPVFVGVTGYIVSAGTIPVLVVTGQVFAEGRKYGEASEFLLQTLESSWISNLGLLVIVWLFGTALADWTWRSLLPTVVMFFFVIVFTRFLFVVSSLLIRRGKGYRR